MASSEQAYQDASQSYNNAHATYVSAKVAYDEAVATGEGGAGSNTGDTSGEQENNNQKPAIDNAGQNNQANSQETTQASAETMHPQIALLNEASNLPKTDDSGLLMGGFIAAMGGIALGVSKLARRNMKHDK